MAMSSSRFSLPSFFFLFHFLLLAQHILEKGCVLVTQSCPTLCDPMDGRPPGYSIQGILQARILEWIVIPFFRGSFWLRDWLRVSCTIGRFSTIWSTREAPEIKKIRNPGTEDSYRSPSLYIWPWKKPWWWGFWLKTQCTVATVPIALSPALFHWGQTPLCSVPEISLCSWREKKAQCSTEC